LSLAFIKNISIRTIENCPFALINYQIYSFLHRLQQKMADDLDAEFALFQAELANVEAAVEVEKEENADEQPQTEKLPPPPVPPPISSSPTDADLPLPEPAAIQPLPRPAAAPQIISAPPQIAAPPQPYQPPAASKTLSPQHQHQHQYMQQQQQQQQHYGYMGMPSPGGMPLDPNNPMMGPDGGGGGSLIGQQPTKKVGIVRQAAGEKWVDPTLVDWPENDYRIFVGNLGPEVNDTMLAAAFQHYTSFTMAKVVREKWKNKSKGYGFVSFQDPLEGGKVLREMDKKYIGNRPCNLKKSTWDARNVVDNKTGKARKRFITDTSGKAAKRRQYDYDQQQ